MVGKGRFKVKITSSYDAQDYLLIRVGRRDTLDDIMNLCLRNMEKTHSKKATLVLHFNDSMDALEHATFGEAKDVIEYPALGELEDGTKVLLVPVVLGDDGIRFVGAQIIVRDLSGRLIAWS
jgi:hypothetical protein